MNRHLTKTSTGKLLAEKRSYFPVILSVRRTKTSGELSKMELIKMNYKFACLAIFPILLTGCINESKDISIEKIGSQTYLIDQSKKEAFLVSKDKLIKLKQSNPTALSIGEVLQEKSKISEERIEVDASIKFLETKALFIVKISPVEIKTTNEDGTVKDDKSNFEWYENAIKSYDSNNYVKIHFKDKDNFKLFEKEIRISRDYIRTVNYDGEVGTYRYEGALNIDADTAIHITSMDFVWSIE
jgi:hypothetical protein